MTTELITQTLSPCRSADGRNRRGAFVLLPMGHIGPDGRAVRMGDL
jgi:hypothetical protein